MKQKPEGTGVSDEAQERGALRDWCAKHRRTLTIVAKTVAVSVAGGAIAYFSWKKYGSEILAKAAQTVNNGE